MYFSCVSRTRKLRCSTELSRCYFQAKREEIILETYAPQQLGDSGLEINKLFVCRDRTGRTVKMAFISIDYVTYSIRFRVCLYVTRENVFETPKQSSSSYRHAQNTILTSQLAVVIIYRNVIVLESSFIRTVRNERVQWTK